MVIDNPEKFGLTKEKIKETFDAYGEPLHHEGRAREDIIKRLVRKKWIRIRKWPNKFYTVQFFHKSMIKMEYIEEWAKQMITSGVSGFKELDPYFPVVLSDLGRYNEEFTISELAGRVNECVKTKIIFKVSELKTIPLYEDFWDEID